MELGDFIKKYSYFTSLVIYKSGFLRKLDDHDVSEIIYTSLWKAHSNFDPTKSSIQTYITRVTMNYLISLVRRKRSQERLDRIARQTKSLSYEESNPIENFTDEEWEVIKPMFEGSTFTQTAKELGISRSKYRTILDKIGDKLKNRV